MENKLGRYLLYNEDVHHKNEDKTDNSPDNLEVLTKADHARKHVMPLEPIKCICGMCDAEFYLKPREYRLRLRRNVSGKLYCSRKCFRSSLLRAIKS
jgi:hypothetical protein